MQQTKISIRPGTETDLPSVFSLIEELALFEKEPHEVKTNPEILLSDFRENKFELTVAQTTEGEVIGMAIYYKAYSTWKGFMYYLDDIVIKESYRGSGIGQALFSHLIELVKDKGANLLKWQVLDWNEPAIKFYEKNKASIETNWWNGKLIF